ncbi:aminotransferase [Caulobacter flavus]|uniref:aspartate transaminase n=1 Tax=Caulobacter flavus TaxID=1679497 RepID=A0A2N5CUW7_9CAUL|nr:aminotransferase [Caulobacter flavus]AYV45371.1 aminotransferase [Caulobacter flavus]PLR17601.1 aminotransferase [Caulobacter flavus]
MVHPVFADLPVTVFEEMSGLAREMGAINLGQGFPDDQGPIALRRKAGQALIEGSNQYPPMRGLPLLRQAVAAHYGRAQGLDLDPDHEIIVTSGATEALAAAFLSLISPGDEVVLFQPLYDAYLPMVRRAGGVPRLVRLAPPHWRFDRAMLEAAFSDRTKLVVLNSPLNPAGVVMADEDLALLAQFCVRHDVIAVCDEVWEAVVFDGRAHKPLMTFPGMRERTVKIGSAGKLFGMTGWKVGFLCAAPALARALAGAHQFLTFTTPPNLQAAVAFGLDEPGEWFETMPAGLQRSRDRLAAGLRNVGFSVLDSAGTYFLNVDLAASGIDEPDRAFALRAVREQGVAAIPVSAFYAKDPVTSVLRLCFAKGDDVLDAAVERLARAKATSASLSK